MADSKKRKIGYVDRAQTLSSSKKMPNVCKDAVAVLCQRNRKYTFACKFKHKITVAEKEKILDAIVLENDICVLIVKSSIKNVEQVVFPSNLSTDGVSGRMKKGAQNLKAGATICSIIDKDGHKTEYVTPVGGKLLELNDSIVLQPGLLQDSHENEGYIAVIYPDTEIPSLDGFVDCKSLIDSCNGRLLVKGVCFDFQQGSCSRGDNCRFKHKL